MGDTVLYRPPSKGSYVPITLSARELSEGVGQLLYTFITVLRDFGCPKFTIPKGSPGLATIMQSVVAYARGLDDHYNLAVPE